MVTSPIDVADLAEYLPVVTPYIDHIAVNHDGDSVSDVTHMLMNRISTLHFYKDEGFVILQWLPGECHVQIACTFNNKPVGLVEAINATCEYAKQFNCSKLTFTTSRKGFERIALKAGCIPESVTYKREF